MLRDYLADTSLFVLPVLAMGIFMAIFAAVLVRVCQRARTPEYRRMAALPLDEDNPRSELS
ncbi:MAG: hypothetical protein FJ265_01895 [Planctomycetes bacterium]|nr:hypothetical protein [Planctomycetota bacterium]